MSKYEKETIIVISEGNDTIQIYTVNTQLKRKVVEYAKKYPEVAMLYRWIKEGNMTYLLDESKVSICLLLPYSYECKGMWTYFGFRT